MKKLKNFLGPFSFLTILLAPIGLDYSSQVFLAIFALVICLWIFTEIPLFISGILGVTLSSLFGIVSTKEAFSSFSDPIIFLFLAGFLLSRALEKSKLDQRMAEFLLGHHKIQNSPKLTIISFLSLSFVLSMWVSNTASVAMLLPLAFGVIKKLKREFQIDNEKLNELFLLSLAYSATLGGNVTPIGSPPNLVAIGFLKNLTGIEIGFLQWMVMAAPFSMLIFFIVCKKCIALIPSNVEKEEAIIIDNKIPLNNSQKYLAAIFLLTVLFWILPSILVTILPVDWKISLYLKNNLSASVVGIVFASLLFLFPLNADNKILAKEDVSLIDWGSLLLFGSGLSLGKILFKTGIAKSFAESLSSFSGSIGPVAIVLLLVFITIFFTELASNTASANILVPLFIAFSKEVGFSPVAIAFSFAIACNSAFMLPVATPPNVIVFGTGKVKKQIMIKSGIYLNLICAILIGFFIVLFK